MVRITNAIYHEAYEYIKQDSVDGNCIIFVAPDVDSLCAVLIFKALLKSDVIPHKIVPISGTKDLVEANEKLVAKDENLRSIVLINCGGKETIHNFFTTSIDTKIYIIDSHRPLVLDNLTMENNYICVFDDDSETERMKPIIEAYESILAHENANYDSEESDEDFDEDGRPIDSRARQRRRLNEGAHGSDRNERRRHNRMVAEYYREGASYCTSVASMVYRMAQQLGKSNNELLWLAIVGVTSLYIFEKMDTYKYIALLDIFKDERARFNVDRDEDGSLLNSHNIVIKAEDEYRFILFRHWSLYDSMYHSGYVSSKLGVWKDVGKKRLNNMFAKMGFSLQQCQQVYTHMNLELKQTLRNKIEVVAPLYGLTDICFPSFTRSYGWECSLSASDVVYAISTIMETSPTAAAKLGVTLKWNETDEWQSFSEYEATTTKNPNELGAERKKWWMKNFYAAYDALNTTSPDGLLCGLKLCMKTQKAIVRQGTTIIDKKSMKLLNNYRYFSLETGPDLSLFEHPSSLTKLGLFLTDAYREHGKKNLPILLASLDEKHQSSILLALTGAPTFGETRKNPFGLAFEEAAETTKARISFDNFDQTVVQIHANDLEHFVESVYYKAR